MISFPVAYALLLHIAFWGVGFAMLVMPKRWARFWPVMIFPSGLALQSIAVWFGAYANLRGTNSYAWYVEVLPLAILVVAFVRRGLHGVRLDLGRFGLVWIVMTAALAILVLPIAIASRGLTSISLGSCDAADYAAGARVFMEFAHTDRSGFLGLTEVVRVMSTDNFFDFWLRLNHFTPSAVIALNGSVLHCAPHELVSLLTMVIVAGSIPVVFWVCRAIFGYSGVASLIIAAVYGISPIPWYSVAHVSPAPLIAAIAIALLTWCGVALWNTRLTWPRACAFFGVLGIAYALILGSYNFILVVSLAPAVGHAGTRASRTGAWSRFAAWLGFMLLPLLGVGIVFWGRVAGLIERFRLFRTYDFGWRIPALTPEGWLGMVKGGALEPWSWGGLRWVLTVAITGLLGWALARSFAARRARVWLVPCLALPVLIGYAYLELRGITRGTNASYDAFKLFTVFFPVLLPAFCWWITLRWSSRLLEWFVVGSAAVAVVGFNLLACVLFIVALVRAPLVVDGDLRQLRRIEPMPAVTSINMLVPDMWSRLWANYFVLRKPQYFLTHTYEGRLNTPLRGEWDLQAGVARTNPDAPGALRLTPHYWLVDTRAPAFVRAQPANGWYDEERLRQGDRWRWARSGASLEIENPHNYPVVGRVRLDARSVGVRDVFVQVGSQRSAEAVRIGEERRTFSFLPVTIPPGKSTLVLHSEQPDTTIAGDARPLALCVFSVVLSTERAP